MVIFNIIAGGASIASLVITLFTLNKVIKIQKILKIDNSVVSNQSVKSKKITKSDIKQAGRDIN
jgi:hypothetical protein